MKICERMINSMQVRWPKGRTKACCWAPIYVGNLLECDIPQLRHGQKMREYLEEMISGDYSACNFASGKCPFASNGTLDAHMMDIDSLDEIPDWPKTLYIAIESACNYNCTCCGCHPGGKSRIPEEHSNDLEKIESRIREALPYVTEISANGAGEFFCSPRTMRLLADWKPLAHEEECVLNIETNGSLFTPENWEKIKNVGRFHLNVFVTIMSFDEDIYRHLSGTDLPISNLESNLRFVKSLREQGAIDYLELATVMQEENFREMPEMARRCLNEFGADRFRIRPVFPGGIYDENIQWFMDVRNPEHPYFEQYQKMRKDPVFEDPRVLVWSGDLLSNRGAHPGIAAKKEVQALERLISEPDLLSNELKTGKAAIYNMGAVGKLLVSQYKDKANIVCCYGTDEKVKEFLGIPVNRLDGKARGAETPDTVIIAELTHREEAAEKIRRNLRPNVIIIDLCEKLEKRENCSC